MDQGRSDLIAALFAEITCLLEQAHEQAMDGQSSHSNQGTHLEIAESLAIQLRDIAVLASAATIVARKSESPE